MLDRPCFVKTAVTCAYTDIPENDITAAEIIKRFLSPHKELICESPPVISNIEYKYGLNFVSGIADVNTAKITTNPHIIKIVSTDFDTAAPISAAVFFNVDSRCDGGNRRKLLSPMSVLSWNINLITIPVNTADKM